MCINVCLHAYVCTCMNVCMYTCVCIIYVFYMCNVCVCVCICVSMCMCVIFLHVCMYAFIDMCVCVCVYKLIHHHACELKTVSMLTLSSADTRIDQLEVSSSVFALFSSLNGF